MLAFRIRTLTPAERYEVRERISTAWPPTAVHDRYGVPMRIYSGRRHYHPVGLARLGLHVRQLRYLTVMTGDPWFGRMANLFAADMR
jgi:hypothetical protein